MTRFTRSVVIVGGGTAGWITAGVIAARHRSSSPDGLKVTLIESPNINIIGVGEGTWPTLRVTLQKMGVSETDFLRDCDATFKQGSKFVDWTAGNDSYYHPFTLPKGFGDINLAPYWARESGGLTFADAVSFQPSACEQQRAPKTITTPEFAAIANYAYHLDAGKFAAFLKNHCVEKLGVMHVLADVTHVDADDTGHISAIHADGHAPVNGDLFVDCTGFSSLLLGKHYGVPFKACRDHLFIDTALAVQVPYELDDAPIASATISTARTAGWIWDVGLTTRRGVGHVYDSAHNSEDNAFAELKAYLGPQGARLNPGDVRKIAIRAGYRETPWIKNCVAVGLAAGFMEPLEASSIVMTELAAQMIADHMPAARDVMPVLEKRFNALFNYRWRVIIDFLKLHYVLSRRTEPFWVANRDPATIPDSLKANLDLWRHEFPWHNDSDYKDEIFSAASYQYVLYGMGFQTQLPPWAVLSLDPEAAQGHFRDVVRARASVPGQLPANRDLLNKVKTYGFQKV